MRIQRHEHSTKLWLSANDTYNWAHKAGAAWPCSQLSNRRLFVEFDQRGDLVDLAIDGGRGDQDCDSNELDAIVADHLGSSHPEAQPQYIVGRRRFPTLEAAKARAEQIRQRTGVFVAVELAR